MASLLSFLPLVLWQHAGRQQLERRPEPRAATDLPAHVLQYDQVMTTKLVVAYAACIEVIHRARAEASDLAAVDLACGPGRYTICLARYLQYRRVLGVDLSMPMVEAAGRNAAKHGLSGQVQFQHGDVRKLDAFGSGRFDLASFTGAAHHMEDLDTVSYILREMDRITKPEGLVMLMDLARLRTAKLTERYVQSLGDDYVDRGLAEFLEDFRNSMYAVWTPDELRTAIPPRSRRLWAQLVPRGLPTIQIILGLPVNRSEVFIRPGFAARAHPLIQEWYPRWKQRVGESWARETLAEWKLMRLALFSSRAPVLN